MRALCARDGFESARVASVGALEVERGPVGAGLKVIRSACPDETRSIWPVLSGLPGWAEEVPTERARFGPRGRDFPNDDVNPSRRPTIEDFKSTNRREVRAARLVAAEYGVTIS